jgi:antirestriction protein ArdC
MSKVYDIITKTIIEKLEKGVVPWHQPWNAEGNIPMNAISRKQYRGFNVMNLGWSGFKNPFWATYKQINALGGHVEKGQKSTIVVFWKLNEITEKDKENEKESKKIPFIRYYNVFNIEQTSLIDDEKFKITNNNNKIEKCENIVKGYNGPVIVNRTNTKACYFPRQDTINMPDMGVFDNEEEYYCTLFHELTHSTGHKSRLDREEMSYFGSDSYSKEELIAEMGASFLCAMTNIEKKTLDNSASYISAWIAKLKSDTTLIVKAATAAQKAVDLIRGVTDGEQTIKNTT